MQNKQHNKFVRILALSMAIIMILLSVLAVIFSQGALAEAVPIDRYQIDMRVNEAADTVVVSESLTYHNITGGHLSQVVFNLYPNAYRRQLTTPIEMDQMQSAYPNGYTPGGADFFSVLVDDVPADWGALGAAEAFLRVAVDLDAGESCTFRFDYELILPYCRGDFGSTTIAYQLCDFLITPTPWDAHLSEFMTINPIAAGRTVIADVGAYTVRINCPSDMTIAAPAPMTKSALDGDRIAYDIQIESIRHLSLMLSNRYKARDILSDGGTMIAAHMRSAGDADRVLQLLPTMVDYFEQILGEYPLPQLTVAQVEHFAPIRTQSGMILLNDELLSSRNRDELAYQLARAVAMQWFYEKVTHHPGREPWLSEATSAYMAIRYLGHQYGRDRFLNELNARALPAMKMTIPGGLSMDNDTDLYSSVSDYEAMTRNRGMAVFYELSLSMGEEKLDQALRHYVEQNKNRIASLPDFAAALESVTGEPMGEPLVYLLQNITEFAHTGMDWYE